MEVTAVRVHDGGSSCYVNNVDGRNMPVDAAVCPSTGANRTHEAEIWVQTSNAPKPPGGGGRWQASLGTDEGHYHVQRWLNCLQ
jgi:hypothetical protein